MNKYGIEHFHIKVIEYVFPNQNLEEREKFWIKFYNTYHNGYNATLGGDGKSFIDYEQVITLYQKLQNQKQVAEIMGIHPDSVHNILKEHNISIKSGASIQKEKNSKKVNMYDLQNNYLKTFNSIMDAAQYLIDNRLTNCKKTTIRQHISEVCHGKRQTAAKFKWKLAES